LTRSARGRPRTNSCQDALDFDLSQGRRAVAFACRERRRPRAPARCSVCLDATASTRLVHALACRPTPIRTAIGSGPGVAGSPRACCPRPRRCRRALSAAGTPWAASMPSSVIVSATHPGLTALIRNPRPRSCAAARTNASSPALTIAPPAAPEVPSGIAPVVSVIEPPSRRRLAAWSVTDLPEKLRGDTREELLVGPSGQ